MTARFVHFKGEERGTYLVLDAKYGRVLCSCRGWSAPLHAEAICEALEAHNDALYDLFVGKLAPIPPAGPDSGSVD